MKNIELTANLYLKAFKASITHKGITGGTIHDFLRESRIKYYGGKCPVYYIEYIHPVSKKRCVIGGNYAGSGKPKLKMFEVLNFD